MSRSEAADPKASQLGELCDLANDELRRKHLRKYPELLVSENVERLAEMVRQSVRVDVTRAVGAGDSAVLIAEALKDDESMARALRAKGNALWFQGQCRPASELLAGAVQLFAELAMDEEVARTLSTSIQPLILLGEYEAALRNAERARNIFERQQNRLRLARLDINVANIYHRQGHYAEALTIYERAYKVLAPYRDAEAIGVVLHNIAVVLISLDDYERALESYHEARRFLEIHQMPLLVAQADYNIAHLYYLGGEYERALDGLRTACEIALKTGDGYHAALCDLDQSEIYLELNLVAEAEQMAQRALDQFERLGMGFETARCLTNLALATSQQHNRPRALELLDRARAIFEKEAHKAGCALVDLYQAVMLADAGDPRVARQLASNAGQIFQSLGLSRKGVVCELLLSRIALQLGEVDVARENCRDALRQLRNLQAPVLAYRAQFLSGRVSEECGEIERSRAEYQAAQSELDSVRSSLEREELKIAFMANRLEVFERLILLCLRAGSTGQAADEVFEYMERAKCRSLVDAMCDRARPLLPRPTSRDSRKEIQNLRAQLNWYYHRIEIEELESEGRSAQLVDRLWEQARMREDLLLRKIRELPVSGGGESGSYQFAAVTLREIRAALEPGCVLLEYFRAGNQIVAAVVNGEGVNVASLADADNVRSRLRMLQFQLSKFRLGPSYVAHAGSALLEATREHLQELYNLLIAPLQHLLNGDHLVVVPSGPLHYLPMHALHDGERFLIDRYTVSYAPSAGIYALTQRRATEPTGPSLVFGIQDSKAPWILNEVEEVVRVVPEPSLFLGSNARREVLEQFGAQSRLIHIATHGLFRTDNPMFSSIRLGDSHLSVYDLYNMHLPVELLTLSGCGTGLNVVAAGDELIGLARGLLHAGAQSLLLTLWDVHDRSTAEFMRAFYRHLGSGFGKANAARNAMFELREAYPHPYYWAPFTLIGKAS